MTKRTGAMLAIAAYTTVTVAGMGLFAVNPQTPQVPQTTERKVLRIFTKN